jgi:hypothetical protein
MNARGDVYARRRRGAVEGRTNAAHGTSARAAAGSAAPLERPRPGEMRPPNGQSLVCALACCCATSAAGAGAGASGAAAPLRLQAEGATDDNAAAPWPLQKGMHFLGKSFEGTYGERTQLARPAAHTHPVLTRCHIPLVLLLAPELRSTAILLSGAVQPDPPGGLLSRSVRRPARAAEPEGHGRRGGHTRQFHLLLVRKHPCTAALRTLWFARSEQVSVRAGTSTSAHCPDRRLSRHRRHHRARWGAA